MRLEEISSESLEESECQVEENERKMREYVEKYRKEVFQTRFDKILNEAYVTFDALNKIEPIDDDDINAVKNSIIKSIEIYNKQIKPFFLETKIDLIEEKFILGTSNELKVKEINEIIKQLINKYNIILNIDISFDEEWIKKYDAEKLGYKKNIK